MKTMRFNLTKIGAASALVLALAAAPGIVPALAAKTIGSARGGAALLQPKAWYLSDQTPPARQGSECAPPETHAMTCPKCRSVAVTHTHVEKGHIVISAPGIRHLCPGCESRIVTVGYGHQARTRLVHTCKNCGYTDPFCCATRQGEGPTPGMVMN